MGLFLHVCVVGRLKWWRVRMSDARQFRRYSQFHKTLSSYLLVFNEAQLFLASKYPQWRSFLCKNGARPKQHPIAFTPSHSPRPGYLQWHMIKNQDEIETTIIQPLEDFLKLILIQCNFIFLLVAFLDGLLVLYCTFKAQSRVDDDCFLLGKKVVQ